MLRNPRGIALGFEISCMASALLMADTTTPINGSSRISRVEIEWDSC